MDKMREGFSVHCQLWRYPEDIDENGFFTNQVTQRAWNAWQSAWHDSRKALVVELPITVCRTHVFEIPYTHEVGMEHDEYFEVDGIHKALDAAGVAYK